MEKYFNEQRLTILDGAMGTLLQKAGVETGKHPEVLNITHAEEVVKIHSAYVNAGSEIIYANTFGANVKKLQGSGYTPKDVITAGIACAKKAAGAKAKVALDIGPLGEMMEPSGTLSFEAGYNAFCEVVKAGKKAGAELIVIETMTDLLETKAAVLAAVENSDLPVMVSMSFEEDGRTFAGVPVEGFASCIGPLGVSALGINCSLGPVEVMPLLQRLCSATTLPVFAVPNAGLPHPVLGTYDLSDEEFTQHMQECVKMGVSLIGGCCGTTPDTIKMLSKAFSGKVPSKRCVKIPSRVCGVTKVVDINGVVSIGERINPTGKKRLQEALRQGDLSYVQTLAVEQEKAGAKILDVNVGAVGVDEEVHLPLAVKAVQAVSGLPLQLDSSNPKAIAAALRVYCGKAVVNSTSGEDEKMKAILPLCKKYGAAVVGLCLDEEGIAKTAEKRVKIANIILQRALEEGMPKEDVWIDCLCLSAGAEASAAEVVLNAISEVKKQLGLKTVLGVSNISFGLPNRELLNRSFLAMALQSGLDLPILNPGDAAMMDTVSAYSALLEGESAQKAYVQRCEGRKSENNTKSVPSEINLSQAIEQGLKSTAQKEAKRILEEDKLEPLAIVERWIIPALEEVGKGFEEKRVFLPGLLASATAAQAAFSILRDKMGTAPATGGPVVVATVQGDVHDIGKNIAKTVMESYGISVIDLGRDVAPQDVLQAVQKHDAKMVGLSALMTTTLPAMEKTVELLKEQTPNCKIMLGGAVLTEEYVKDIGADLFAKNAKISAEYAHKFFSEK